MHVAATLFDQAGPLGLPGYAYPAGASAEQVDQFELLAGHRLPATLRAMYLRHDGEVLGYGEPSPELFFGLPFISLQEATGLLESFRESIAMEPRLGPPGDRESVPAGVVQTGRYNLHWLPFAGMYSPDYLMVDMAPGPLGIAGQIVLMSTDERRLVRISDSFDDLIDLTLRCYSRQAFHPKWGYDKPSLFERPPV